MYTDKSHYFAGTGDSDIVAESKYYRSCKKNLANSTVYTWNKEYVEKLLNLIMILVQEIPVYRLINRADHDSVEIVKKELQKEVI